MEHVFFEPEFDWDEHNLHKNWIKHKVKYAEAEEAFFDLELKILPDPTHSSAEKRFIALGQTKAGRKLFLAFVERRGKIRVISARDMNRKERNGYKK
jgi:hypothetical protein